MLAEIDQMTLREAGINDPDRVLAAAAAFLREHPIYRVLAVGNALSVEEETFLSAGGASGVGRDNSQAKATNVAVIAGEYAEMEATAYSQQEVAKLLAVSTSRVRQRLDNGSLYSISGVAGRVCPRFQFLDDRTLPGLETVLAALSDSAHPVAVQRFFLSVQRDLESGELGTILSPREWLMTGHDPEAVAILARDL